MAARYQQSSHAQAMFEKVERFLGSELSQTEFCQQHGLAYWTFRYWLKKYQARQPVPLQPAAIPTDFIPLRLQASEPLLQSPTCEIEYPFQFKMGSPRGYSPMASPLNSIDVIVRMEDRVTFFHK